MATKKQIMSRYKKALRRVKHEQRMIDNSQARQRYWAKVTSALAQRLELVNDGQIEMKIQG